MDRILRHRLLESGRKEHVGVTVKTRLVLVKLIQLLICQAHHECNQVKLEVVNHFSLHDIEKLVHPIGYLVVHLQFKGVRVIIIALKCF